MKIIFLLPLILISFHLGRGYERKKFFYVGKPIQGEKKKGEVNMGELKPCPWPECKNSNKDWLSVVQRDFLGEPMYQVRCHNCGATGPLDIDEEQAISAWNRRS